MRISFPGLLLLGLLMAACQSEPEHAPAIGEAYVGPATLNLRREINPRSAVVGAARHGERLEIIQRRRRFFKVRTAAGQQGWTDEYLLLTADEVGRLRRLAEQARTVPSQGVATTYDTLNLHTEPSRFSPSFLQVKEAEKVDLIAHELAPRKPPPRKPLVTPAPKPAAAKKTTKPSKVPPPPLPPAPKPPADWLQLSQSPPPAAEAKPEPEPEPMDDWALVRTAGGESGWVLMRRLFMAIPDEVAQYAEGRRITSYFPLGEVRDGDQVKHNWLWTTIEQSLQPYDFDSFRVFVWSVRRHRYETAFIQRRVKGYYPTLFQPPGFSVCLEKADGQRYRRRYTFVGYLVRPAGEKPCEAVTLHHAPEPASGTLARSIPESIERPADSLYARLKDRWAALRRRWFNR